MFYYIQFSFKKEIMSLSGSVLDWDGGKWRTGQASDPSSNDVVYPEVLNFLFKDPLLDFPSFLKEDWPPHETHYVIIDEPENVKGARIPSSGCSGEVKCFEFPWSVTTVSPTSMFFPTSPRAWGAKMRMSQICTTTFCHCYLFQFQVPSGLLEYSI